MNNCHLWILKIYQVDIRNIHYPWYIDGIRKIYTKIYAIVYYVVCTVMQDYQVNCCHLHCHYRVLITPAESYDGFIPSEASDVAILAWSKSKTPKSILP